MMTSLAVETNTLYVHTVINAQNAIVFFSPPNCLLGHAFYILFVFLINAGAVLTNMVAPAFDNHPPLNCCL